jgi:hypothetical protein
MFAAREKSCSNEKTNWFHNKKLRISVIPHEILWSRQAQRYISGMYSVCNFVPWIQGDDNASSRCGLRSKWNVSYVLMFTPLFYRHGLRSLSAHCYRLTILGWPLLCALYGTGTPVMWRHISTGVRVMWVVIICTTCSNTLKLCILPTECICVFRMVLTINSDCFPKQH